MNYKDCTKCKENLSEDNFFFKSKAQGRRHSQCKECYRKQRSTTYDKHYAEKKEEYVRRAIERNKKNRLVLKTKFLEFLEGKVCTMCGYDKQVALEFHHRDPTTKSETVSRMLHSGYAWGSILKEIEKCDIVCANCHRELTAEQFEWYKV